MKTLIKKCLKKFVKSSTDSQTSQVELLADETIDTEQLEPYGVTSVPPDEVGVGVVAVYDDRHQDKSVLLGWFDGLFRPKGLEPGEVCFYSQFGQKMKFNKDGKIIISDSSGSSIVLNNNNTTTINTTTININAKDANFTGNITAEGTVSGSDVAIGGNSIANHTHTQTNNQQTSVMNNPLP